MGDPMSTRAMSGRLQALDLADAPVDPHAVDRLLQEPSMDVSVIVAASRVCTSHVEDFPTIGALADNTAGLHGVPGDTFTLKVNGELAQRSATTNALSADDVLELVEQTDPVATTVDDSHDDAEPTEGE